MPLSLLRGLTAFLLPGGLLFLLQLIAAGHPDVSPRLAHLEGVYPATVAVIALLLGWRFDRSRLVFATVVIALAGIALHAADTRLHDAITVLLPLNIAVIALLKERGIFTWHGLLRWAVIAAQIAGLGMLLYGQRVDWLHGFGHALLPLPALDALRLGQPALLAFGLALTVTAIQGLRQRNAMEYGLFWALATMLFALLATPIAGLLATGFATAVLILVIALLEVSHFMAYRDELTGLPGRRALNQALLKLGGRYTIAMLDVDHFKKFNDTYGHDVGDEVLKMVAARLKGVKGGGKPFRYGGEEFTVLFAGRRAEDALPHLERLRVAIADAPFTVRGRNRPKKKGEKKIRGSDRQVQITISIGAAEPGENARDPQAVIKAADKALYRAKKAGRNRVAA
ncbi:MAG: GGDEF domain-containing protein [Gammaproteobacteria bacterium]|nr:GGDEF domain-containing protein [Gammaproteobacteria bacterium]MDX5374546.1 GGDEF domain-containing protein [Gammaproteobacteria bacterium]